MYRTILLTVFALTAPSDRGFAQAAPSLPVIRPKVTELGEFRDTTLRAELIPQESSLSPSGTLIAYSTVSDLRIWDVKTHLSQVVLKGWSEGITWSPAGDAIAFAHESDEGSQELVWMLRVNPITGETIGSPQRVSLSATTGIPPQFSPNGRSIAFARQDAGEHSSLVVSPAAGGTERVLASGYGISKLRWGADGKNVYYVSRDSAKTKAVLSRIAVDGGTSQVVHNFTESVSPALSPDNQAVMLSERAGRARQSVRIGDPSGRSLATLSIPAGVEVGDWSGAYRQAGVRATYPRGLRIINVADGKSRDLIDSTADVQAVAWFGDSQRLAAIVFYDHAGVLVTMNADGTGVRKMPLASQPSRDAKLFAPPVEKLRVSPDGRYAAYLGRGGRSLELVDLSTGNQQTLTRAPSITTPFWRPDSRTVRYMRRAETATSDPLWLSVHDVSLDGTDKLVRAFPRSQYPTAKYMTGDNYVSIFGGSTTSLARLDGSPDQLLLHGSTQTPGVVSPDGRTIAMSPGEGFTRDSTRKVILHSLSDGSQRTADMPVGAFYCGSFSPDGRYVYCRGRAASSGLQALYEVPIDGSKARLVTRVDSKEAAGASALSPDGKKLVQTVAGVRRAAFVSLDFSEAMTRLLPASAKP